MPGGQIRPHQSQAPQQQSRAEDHANRGNDGVSSHDEENDASGQHRSAVDDRQRKIRIPLHAVAPPRTVVRASIVRHRGPFCAASLPPACARGGFTAMPIKMGRAPPGRHPSTMTTLSDPAAFTRTCCRAGAAPSYSCRAGSADSFARSRRRHHSRRSIPAATQIRAMMVCAPVIRRMAPTTSSPRTVRPEPMRSAFHSKSWLGRLGRRSGSESFTVAPFVVHLPGSACADGPNTATSSRADDRIRTSSLRWSDGAVGESVVEAVGLGNFPRPLRPLA